MSTDSSPFADLSDNWRDRLLASLRDCGVQRAPRNPVVRWIVLIVVLVLTAILTIVVRKMLEQNLKTEPNPFLRLAPLILWYLFAIFVLFRIRNWFIRRAWKSTAATAEDELAKPGARRPILYLRSFGLDERINRRSFGERFLGEYPSETAEQALCKTLKHVGPTIAIGRPGEQLPSLGAARFYVTDDRWQQKVEDIATEAQYVVWASGSTEGLRWEIEHLIAQVPPEKIILWTHPHLLHKSPAARETEWTRFRTNLGSAFPKPLPETLGEARFIYFDENWNPRPVAPQRRLFPWFSPIRAALGPLMAVKAGHETSRLRRWGARLGKLGLGLIVAAIFAAVFVLIFPDRVWTSERDGQPQSQIPYVNEFHAFSMIAFAVIALMTITLVWGRSSWWRKTRLVLIAGLSALAVVMSGMTISAEKSREFRNEVSVSAKSSKTDEVVQQEKNVYWQRMTMWVYLKLAVAIGFAAATTYFVKTRWRAAPLEAVAIPPPTDADIAYPGPGNDTFAELIGVGGPAIHGPRVGGFVAAMVIAEIVTSLLVYQTFSMTRVIWTLLLCVVTLGAFRILKAGVAPVIAAIVFAGAWIPLSNTLTKDPNAPSDWTLMFAMDNVGRTAVPILAMLAVSSWAVRRIGPRPFALWLGAMAMPMAGWLMRYLTGLEWSQDREKMILAMVLEPLIYAAAMEYALRFTDRESMQREALTPAH